jgi:hypothetical protein
MHIYVDTYTHAYTRTHTHTHIHTYTHTHIHTHTHTRRHNPQFTHAHTQLSPCCELDLVSLNTPRILCRAHKCRDRQPLSGRSRDAAVPPRRRCPLVACTYPCPHLMRALSCTSHAHLMHISYTGCREQDLLRADDPEAYLILLRNTVVAPMPPSLPVPSRPKHVLRCATERDGEEGEASIKSLLLRVIGRALAVTPSLPWVPAWKRKSLTFSSILAAGYREVMTLLRSTPAPPSIFFGCCTSLGYSDSGWR